MLGRIVTDNQTIDNTITNDKGDVYFAAFGEKAPLGAILKLGFDNSHPEKEIKVTFVLLEKNIKSEGKHDGEPSIIFPSATLIWEYYGGGKWKQLSIKKDTTYALNRSGRIIFDWPPDIDNDKNTYWIQCRISDGNYEIVPRLSKILLNTISAVQIERIRTEEKGWGIPDQVIQLYTDPYINRIEFATEDILDWIGLFNQLKIKGISSDPGHEKKILGFFEQDIRDCMNGWNGDKEPDEIFKLAFIESLNRILKSGELYDSNSFKDLSQLPKKFLNKELVYCSDLEMKTLNRFLIESVFPDKIERNRLVIQLETSLFSWNEIPGKDVERLKEFLTTKYSIDWIKNAVLERIDDNQIRLSNGNKFILLSLNNKKDKIRLEIDDGRTDELYVKNKNDNLNIYESEYWYEIEDFEFSCPEDTHYIYNQEKNQIIFGNGLNGFIPGDSQDIVVSFKTTLGPGGNIPKGQDFIINEPGISTIPGKN
jgi:hypothetical protein